METGLRQGLANALGVGRVMLQVLSDSAVLALMPDDARTRLKGMPGGTKKVAW